MLKTKKMGNFMFCHLFFHIVIVVCKVKSENTTENSMKWHSDYDYYDYYYDYDYTYTPPNYFDLDGKDCENTYTCNSTLPGLMCQCDVICDLYGDCCYDADTSNTSIRVTDKQRDLMNYVGCKLLADVYKFWYIYVIDSCPSSTNSQLHNLCTNIEDDDITSTTPATGKTSGMIYRNMFCAICHGEDFKLWLPQIDCRWGKPYSGNYTALELLQLEECELDYRTNDSSVKIRNCNPALSTCSANSTNGVNIPNDKCQSTPNKFVYTPEKVYKNKYCYECDDERADNVSCAHSYHNLSLSSVSRGSGIYSFKLLFNLQEGKANSLKDSRFTQKEEDEYTLDNNCNIGQVYDPFAQICRTIMCSEYETFKNGQCVRNPTNSSQYMNSKSCDFIQFNDTEFVRYNETTITLRLSNKTYHNVRIENNTAFVCIKIRKSVREIGEIFSTEGILSLVCGTISIFFLLLTIFVYSSRKMRNMAGKILLCLSTSLCMAHLLFLVASTAEHIPMLCTVIALFTHYFYLASFTWMNVMSFDIHSTFSVNFYNAKDNIKRFILYSLYAWGLPLVIVCCGIVTDQVTLSSWRPAYGTIVCWISNSNGLIAFFLIPVAALVSSNFFLYSRTSWNIFKTKRKSAKKFNKRDKCEILIYVKLSTVMGLTWVFAYVATIFNEDALWYLFIILNGSQGLLIFCSFVLNKKVLKIVRDTINIKQKTNGRSNITSTTV